MDAAKHWKSLNLWGWVLAMAGVLLAIYSFCVYRFPHFAFVWHFAPPRAFIICLAVIALVLGLLGIKSGTNKVRSVFTILLSVAMIPIMLSSLAAFTRIKLTQSPDKRYTVSFYSFDGGAMDSPTFYGYMDGPLWFKKEFYLSGISEAPEAVSWTNNFTLAVNGRSLNLKQGEMYNGLS